MQQAIGERLTRSDTSRLDCHRYMDGALDESLARSPGADKLLGLNIPRGSLVGGAQGESRDSSPPFFMGSPTRPYSCDDSGYQASHSGSPHHVSHPLDMSSPGKGGAARRNRMMHADSPGAFPPQSPSSPSSLQGPFSPSAMGPRPFRAGPLSNDCGNSLMMSPSSRSDSPESDSSVNSLDNPDLSDIMSRLYIQARARSDSGISAGLPSSCDDYHQHELANLANLYALQSLTNNSALKYYQQSQQMQGQSPLGSPLSSPLAAPDKSWSPGSLNNSPLSSSLPGSPLYMSSPMRGTMLNSAPGSPPICHGSPLAGPVARLSSSLDSNGSVTRFHRNPVASHCDATCTWSGTLPPRSFENPTFSVKVFLGGVPWDINDAMLVHAFKPFGPGMIRVDWPGSKQQGVPPPKGYVYIIFESEKQVKALLQACSHDYSGGACNWYFKISSKRMKAKEVQVIPWTTSDTNWVRNPHQKLDPEKTVFVGALHGMLNAHGLATIMNDLFDGVVYAGIDTDKFKYPIGSARVTFNNNRSFYRAVNSRFIEIKTDKFIKKVQVDPYLEDSPCSMCSVQQGPYFCRESSCFRYFCRSCWNWRHSQNSSLLSHSALMRSSKSGSGVSSITDVGMGFNMGMSLSLVKSGRDLSRLSSADSLP